MDLSMDSTSYAKHLLGICIILAIGVVFLIAAGGNNSGNLSTTLTSSNQPSVGNTITLDGHIFEFTSGGGVATGHIAVLIGATLSDTTNNLNTTVGQYYSSSVI